MWIWENMLHFSYSHHDSEPDGCPDACTSRIQMLPAAKIYLPVSAVICSGCAASACTVTLPFSLCMLRDTVPLRTAAASRILISSFIFFLLADAAFFITESQAGSGKAFLCSYYSRLSVSKTNLFARPLVIQIIITLVYRTICIYP